jgi:predicted CopG family antitoxin
MRKSVRLTDEAYARLLKCKRENESYSDEVMRLTEKEVKRPLSSFAGCWKGDKEELDRITAELEKERREAKSGDFEK